MSDAANKLARLLINQIQSANAKDTNGRTKMGMVVDESPLTIQPVGGRLKLGVNDVVWSDSARRAMGKLQSGDTVVLSMTDGIYTVVDAAGRQDDLSISADEVSQSGGMAGANVQLALDAADTRLDGLESRATALEAEDDSHDSRLSALEADKTYTAFTFAGTWNNYATISGDTNWHTAGFSKSEDGLVTLTGVIARSGTSGLTIGQLPVGHRPTKQIIFPTLYNGTIARVDVDINGYVILVITEPGTAIGYMSLSGINFLAGA